MITNFKNLARNPIRKKALLIAEAGYEIIDIKKTVEERVKKEKRKEKNFLVIRYQNIRSPKAGNGNIGKLNVKKLEINLDKYKRIFLVGVGKGSAQALTTLTKILDKKLTKGIALDTAQYQDIQRLKTRNNIKTSGVQRLEILTGTHPLPSKKNIIATQKIIKLVKNLKKDDLLITFICGGGSALFCASEKEQKNSILATKLLTQAGANILELNTIRKHLSVVKGGGLAKLAYPANIISLIVSDVLGNDLSMVASGPTVFDKTTKKDAEKILRKYFNIGTSDVLNISDNFRTFRASDIQKLIRALTETPKNKKFFRKTKNILFLSNREPILAMAKKAKELGFKTKIYSYSLKGEAKNVLLPLIKNVSRVERTAILAGGETTVVLTNDQRLTTNNKVGKGGRNMESVLGVINLFHNSHFPIHNSVVMSFASDGRDNTEAAGAIADSSTIQKAKKLKLDPQVFLNRHDSFNFFKKTGDLIFTKQKTFNVADLMLVLSLLKK